MISMSPWDRHYIGHVPHGMLDVTYNQESYEDRAERGGQRQRRGYHKPTPEV